MTLTIEKTVQEEIELESEFPLFRHKAPFFYKVLSLTNVIVVSLDKFHEGACVEHMKNKSIISQCLTGGVVIPENKFIEAYVKAVHAINELVKDEAELQRLELNELIKDEFKFPFTA